MQVHITGRHIEITNGIRDHVYEKVERTLKDFPRVEDVRVILDLQKLDHFAEVLVQGKDLHVETKADAENMYKAIDDALDKAERRLRKLREKVKDHHPHGD
ncbi:MAG: putative sigma-54 modulation protein [Verrucomicrobiota bacterium]|jgi:putative sigma-54 modulation protein|nr:putative sigma-54 modulation protein [Verrucomicrobiota bacterium]MDK2963556.1 putative sigma-54 modulation protein [Verrucomicrobiota bacterium]